MKVNTSLVLKTLDGKELLQAESDKEKQITVGVVCIEALLRPGPDDNKLSGEDKLSRWELAKVFNSSKDVDLSAEQIVLLKKLISFSFPIIVVGQMYKILEGK